MNTASAIPAARVAGVDEAGRGPLAGPVVAAAVILGADHGIAGIRDSKKLTAVARARLAEAIGTAAIATGIGRAEPREIDRLNILQATMLAMARAVAALAREPGLVLVDGNRCPALPCPARAEIRGDDRIEVIAAASILAKETRDAEMRRLDADFPEYGFAGHKGYPTAAHRAALARHGPCIHHRMSFAPVRAVLRDPG